MTLDDFLEELRGSGEATHGAFSINPARAMELLGTHQLPERRAYILKLVQWAVEAGATEVKTRCGGGRVALFHDGEGVSDERLTQILTGTGRLDHLTRGLYGALGLAPSELKLVSNGRATDLVTGESFPVEDQGGQGVIISGIKKRWLERSPMVRQVWSLRWHMIDMEGPLQRLMLDAAGLTNLEAAILRWYAAYAPIPIWLGKTLLNRPVLGVPMKAEPVGDHYNCRLTTGRHEKLCFHLRDLTKPLLAPAVPVTGMRYLWFHRGYSVRPSESGDASSKIQYEGHLMKAAEVISTHRGSGSGRVVAFVQDGVIVDHSHDKFKPRSFSFAAASGLAVSANGFELVRNSTFQELLERVHELIDIGDR